MPRAQLNGVDATAGDLAGLAFAGYAHFTFMQVRDRRVRGLGLHLDRLRLASLELFGRAAADERVRQHLRAAIAGQSADLSLGIYCFSRDGDAVLDGRPVEPELMVTTGPLAAARTHPVRVRSVRYERDLPLVKHAGTFGLTHQTRLARLAGVDDALFVDGDGAVSEGSIWNVGFHDGDGVVWSDAPALPGIMMRLIQAGLAATGVPSQTRPVRLAEVGGFRAAFLTNSICPGQPIVGIDDQPFREDPELMALLRRAHDANEPEPF